MDALAKDQYALLSFLGLSAAFNAAYHGNLLLSRKFAFETTAFCWFKLYLEDDTKSVDPESESTAPRWITGDVSQRSALGPLLFTLCTVEVGEIRAHWLSHHSYADDAQILSICRLYGRKLLKTNVLASTQTVDKWMASNRLQLNPIKMEFMCYATLKRLLHFPRISVEHIQFSTWQCRGYIISKKLGHILQQSNDNKGPWQSFGSHKTIHRSLPTPTAIQLSFVISCLDYCNSILSGVSRYQFDRIQSLLNFAVRLTFGCSR